MQQLKKILFVHHVSVIGGASYCMLNIIKAIDRKMFIPVVLLRNDGPLVEELKKLNVEVYFCPTLWSYPYNQSLYRIRSLITIFNLYRSLDDFETSVKKCCPDIVYLNNTFLFPYLKITQKLRIKSVIHIREHWPNGKHQKQFGYIQQEILCHADRIIAINDYSARMISPSLTKTTIVYDWIDMKTRYRSIPMSDIIGEDCSSKKVLLFTGGQSYIKGTDYILEAFSKYVKGDEYRLLLLGGDSVISLKGWKALVKKLLEMAGYVGFSKKVKDLIASDYRIKCVPAIFELSNIIEQSHCFVSYFRVPHANLGLAENIILCNPCIAAKTEESLEYTNNGEYALLVEPNKVDEFGKQLQGFLQDIDRWKQASKKGVEYLSNKFMPDENIKKLNSVLFSLSADAEVR